MDRALRLLVHNPGRLYRRVHRLFWPRKSAYRKLFRMNLRQWYLYHHHNVVLKKCHWMGVRTLKNPLDAWIYQEICFEVRPEIVVEIGSLEGGSTLYFAHLLDLLGSGRVVSIDIDRTNFHVKHDRIIPITGDSSSPQTIASVYELCQGKSVLVVQDGAHEKESVLQDLRAYSKLVTVNSYFIVEDGLVDLFEPDDGLGFVEAGPLAAIEQFLAENPDFVVDTERERYLLTYNPQGFLRRIR